MLVDLNTTVKKLWWTLLRYSITAFYNAYGVRDSRFDTGKLLPMKRN
jgi:hypothetical protein